MTRPIRMPRTLTVIAGILALQVLHAQQELHWVGGSGAWEDAMHWSDVAGGAGGAGVPGVRDIAVVRPTTTTLIGMRRSERCAGLVLDGTAAPVTMNAGTEAGLELRGSLHLRGAVRLEVGGGLRFTGAPAGAVIDVRGIPLASDVVVDGGVTWTVISDLHVEDGHALVLREGGIATGTNIIRAGHLRFEGRGPQTLDAGTSVVIVSGTYVPGRGDVRMRVEDAVLYVGEERRPWTSDGDDADGMLRGANICGTGPGQTPFSIDATAPSDFNGFDVSCNGICNAVATVAVSGGVGPFNYQWQTGPPTQTWNNTCVGNKLVIVTDLGQGVGCATTVQVVGPPPLGVIFFPALTPPTCAGLCNGTGNALAVGGTGSGYTFNWNNGVGTASSFNQLCAGTNTLRIRDNNNCQFDTTFNINLLPVSTNLTFTNVTCNGACNGTATVAPTGGTGGYTYSWTPAPGAGQGTPNATGLCAGNWSVTVTDANGCAGTTAFTITEPPPVVATAVTTNVACAGDCTGTASLSASGGVGPYTFAWSPPPGGGQGTANATGLCAGTYTATVTDQPSGCSIQVVVTITQPPPFAVVPTVSAPVCTNDCNGSVVLAVTGGTGAYTYAWSPPPPAGQGTAGVTGLCDGSWSVVLADAAGCDTTMVFDLVEPPPVLPNESITPITCPGVCDGVISCATTGGTGTYTYSWSPAPPVGQGTATASGLCAGTWTVTIADAAGCDTTLTVVLTSPPPLTAVPTQTNISCGTACDGIATVVVSGGTVPYAYQWSPAPGGGQGTASATGLCAGPAVVTITDDAGCQLQVPFTIQPAPPITVTLSTVNSACLDLCTGASSAVVGGGYPPYAYQWSPAPGAGQGTPSVTGLCPGAYTLTVTDSRGCVSATPFNVGAPLPIAPNATLTSVSCFGACNGSIVLAPTGGTGAFTYAWSPPPPAGQGTASVSGLCDGSWSVALVDAAGCDTTLFFDIVEPPPVLPNESVTPITCPGVCDGVISCATTGGTGTYTYSWSPAPPVGQGTATASGLCAGTWTVTIADAAGCDTTLTVVLTSPPPLTAVPTQTNISCGTACDGIATVVVSGGTVPYAYQWSPAPGGGQGTASATGLCAGPAVVTITDDAGCQLQVPFTIQPAPPITVTLSTVNSACLDLCTGASSAVVGGGYPPYAYQWSPAPGAGQGTPSVTGLCPGAYTLTVTDSRGCVAVRPFNIGAPLPISANPTVDNVGCFGACDGSISLAPTGGGGTYTYLWSPVPPNGPGTSSATGLCAGTWQVTVGSGVCDTVLVFNITEPPQIQLASVVTAVTCAGQCDGAVAVTVSGGVPGYTYQWSPAPPIGQGTGQVSGLCAGVRNLLLTDASGCDTLVGFNIASPPPLLPQVATTLADCGGACNGTATLTFTGGTGPVTIAWNPPPGGGQGTANATDLCPGLYAVTLTDSLGCDTTLQFVISTPSGIQALPTVVDASCADACDGAISLVVSGGVPPYGYTWVPAPPSGSGASISGLCAGQWTVQIGDLAGCDTVLVLQVNSPTPILPNGVFSNETCNGPCDGTAAVNPTGGTGVYTYNWSPAPPVGQGTNAVSGLCAGDWSVTVTDNSGCDTVWTFTVLPQQPIIPGLTTYDIPCPGTCNGAAVVQPTGGIPGYTYLWSPAPPTGQATDSISGLCLGQWAVVITDAVGCDTTVTFVIAKPAPIQLALSATREDCTGPCTAGAAISPTGGTPGYAILWQPPPASGQGTTTVSGLCAGTTYSVTVTDVAGCSVTQAFTALPYQPIAGAATVVAPSCGDLCDGSASLAVTGGSAPFALDWTPDPGTGDGTANAGQLCTGTYDVLITDDDGCTGTVQVTLTAPPPIAVTPAVTPVGCAGSCAGAITLNATGGGGPLTYTWSPAPAVGQGTGSVQQLCSGTWTVVVSDGAGCDTTITFQLTDPTPLVVVPSTAQSACAVCTGGASLQVSGGGGGYTFTWGAPLNITTTDTLLSGLCAGVYALNVTDALGCSVDLVVPITDAQGEILQAQDAQLTCSGDCNGLVTAAYICTIPACTVTWYDPLGAVLATGTDTLQGLCAGDYLVSLVNGDGCLSADTASVVANDPLQVAFSTSPPSCATACNGSAALSITGGAAPFTISWTPAPASGQGTALVSGLCAGVYTATVTDANGCATVVDVSVIGAATLSADVQLTNVTCAGACDGSAVLQPTGGAAPYVVLWSLPPPNGPSALQSGPLCAGVRTILLTDANGCDTTLTIIITEPAPIAATGSVTTSNCLVCDGTAQLNISGGTPALDVQWTDVNGAPAGSGPQVGSLCAGLYFADITDANGCQLQVTAVISDANGPVLTVTDGSTPCSTACEGEVGVGFTCATGPCEVNWYDAQGNAIAVNQFTVPDLCAGAYYVAVLNGAGCTTIDTAFVQPSQVIDVALTTAPASCNGLCDGTATVLPTGGVAPYTYDWSPDPPTGEGTDQAGGLCPGIWSVLITDAVGCDTTVDVLITEPFALQLSALPDNVSCTGACDGSIAVIAGGGNGGFSYNWSPQPLAGQGTSLADGLCPDDWSVVVTDALGCVASLQVTITEPPPLALSTASTNSNCAICDGTASVQVQGGSPGYAYAWTANGANLGTGGVQTDLCAGFYNVQVIDANGCSAQAVVPVTDIQGEDLTIPDAIVTCPGSCDGELVLSFNCSAPTCVTAWFDGSGNALGATGTVLSNLCAGSYFVSVTNGIGCLTLDTALVNDPAPIQVNLGTTPVTCAGLCDGTAAVSPTGGIGPYTFNWGPDPVTGDGTGQVSGLCAGGYTVLVTDSIGCSITQDLIILAPAPLSATSVLDSVSCNGTCDGGIILTAAGGAGAYTYAWSPVPPIGAGTPTVAGLCAGVWSVTVTDGNGCDTTFQFTLNDPPPLDASLTTVDNQCFGDCIGQASVSVTGGSGAYSYTWTDVSGTVIAQGAPLVNGLCAGNFGVEVMDANGCMSQLPFTIGEGLPVLAGLVFVGETCLGPCDGTATATPTGGAGGYTATWLDAGGNVFASGPLQVQGLCAGNWTLVVADVLGCDTVVPFTILPYTPIVDNAVVSPVLCAGDCNGSIALAPTGGIGGYGYDWDPFPPGGDGNPTATGLCAGGWSVVVTDAVGCDAAFNYTLTDPSALTITVDGVTPASCSSSFDGAIQVTVGGGTGPLTTTWTGPDGATTTVEDPASLPPGDHVLELTDANGCSIQQSVTVPALNSVVADAGPDISQCFGEEVTLNASGSQGATSFTWTDDQGNVLGTGVTLPLDVLAAGAYAITLTATAGPCSDQDTVLINILELPNADTTAGPDQSILLGATVPLGGVPGPPGSTYLWSPDSLVSSPIVYNPTVSPGATTWFVLQLTNQFGCTDVDSVLVTVVPEIVIPTGFSPNADGHNDAWQIDFIDLFPGVRVEIYNRWGELLFTSDGYPVPWDGTYNGEVVPVGTYYYAIDLNDARFPEPYTGPLTVIR